MASSKSKSKSGSPLQSTRQMLDELDALMERMLAVPVGDAEDLPPLPRDVAMPLSESALLPEKKLADRRKESWLDETRLIESSEPSSLPAVPSGQRLDDSGPAARPHFAKSKKPPVPLPEVGQIAPTLTAAPPAIAEESRLATELQQPLEAPAPAQTTIAPAELPARPPVPLVLLPLLWINLGFDAGSWLLGPLGRGLRGARGKKLLGIVGLLCLGLAGVWLVFDQMGWP